MRLVPLKIEIPVGGNDDDRDEDENGSEIVAGTNERYGACEAKKFCALISKSDLFLFVDIEIEKATT